MGRSVLNMIPNDLVTFHTLQTWIAASHFLQEMTSHINEKQTCNNLLPTLVRKHSSTTGLVCQVYRQGSLSTGKHQKLRGYSPRFSLFSRFWNPRQKYTEVCFTRSVGKLKTLTKRLMCFLRFSQVSQHPTCLDHSIQTRESIWYFLNETLKLMFKLITSG